MKWLTLLLAWWDRRKLREGQRIPVPDIRDIAEQDAAREVRILRLQEEQDRLASERAKRLDETGQRQIP